jgi:hypothetical protein
MKPRTSKTAPNTENDPNATPTEPQRKTPPISSPSKLGLSDEQVNLLNAEVAGCQAIEQMNTEWKSADFRIKLWRWITAHFDRNRLKSYSIRKGDIVARRLKQPGIFFRTEQVNFVGHHVLHHAKWIAYIAGDTRPGVIEITEEIVVTTPAKMVNPGEAPPVVMVDFKSPESPRSGFFVSDALGLGAVTAEEAAIDLCNRNENNELLKLLLESDRKIIAIGMNQKTALKLWEPIDFFTNKRKLRNKGVFETE